MIINWVSPLPPAQTDIANYTMRVLPALQRRAVVRLWTDAPSWDPHIETVAPVRSIRAGAFDEVLFAEADITFHHIGNNRRFHGGIWRLATRLPGIVVLHDTRLLQFVAGALLDEADDRPAFDALLRRFYGEDGARAAAGLARGELAVDELVADFPLARAVAEKALGVVLHAPPPSELDDLPYAELPLPFDTASQATPLPAIVDELRLLQFGFIGGNRRLPEIFDALAGFEARVPIVFDIFGPVDDEVALRKAIAARGLESVVRLHGFVAEEALNAALARAHLVFNLRWPSMGEASASQLRIWSHARPALVCDVAWYAAQPAKTLIKIKPGEERVRIQEVLRAMLDDTAPFAAIGHAGYAQLSAHHRSDDYAERLMRLAEDLPRWRRAYTLRQTAERAGHAMRPWMKQPPPSLLVDPVAARLHDLWGDGATAVEQPPPPARFNHPAFSPAKRLARRLIAKLR